jgi:proliferating cell nuclear antigen
MLLTIENKSKQEIFVALFQLLKNWSSHLNMRFEKERLYIQCMDKSHICLADIQIKDNWFSKYECINNTKISVDSTHFAIIINYAVKHEIIEINFAQDLDSNSDPDKLYINFLNGKENKSAFDHFFELDLIDIEEDNLNIPDVEYDVDFIIESKKFVDVLSELNTFGPNLNIKCNENVLELNANDESAKIKVNIPIDELNEFAIEEDGNLNVSFSLNHLCKMCTSTKLDSKINVSLSAEYPMLLRYSLGDDSNVSFYIAPKIKD